MFGRSRIRLTRPTCSRPRASSLSAPGSLPGNTVNLTYTDTATNTQHLISIVNVNDPAALPLHNAANANPKLVGVDFSAGAASVAAQLNIALGGSHLQFSNAAGSLRVVDDGTSSAT